MILFPAIDLYEGKAVRLYKGDYNEMTVYGYDPGKIGEDFASCGAEAIHIVDLEGAKTGGTPNLETVVDIKKRSGLFCEIGGGVRSLDVAERYLSEGIDRVILGTIAVTNEEFVKEAIKLFGDKIAVGADIKNGYVAVKGWTETANMTVFEFCNKMEDIGVKTVICTDISKDGAMKGTNLKLYEELKERTKMNITASGGVSDLDDIKNLRKMGLYGAIVGKAYYTGAIDLKEGVKAAK